MPLKAASALIAILQVVSSLVVLEIILEMFGACEGPWGKQKTCSKSKNHWPKLMVFPLHDYSGWSMTKKYTKNDDGQQE